MPEPILTAKQKAMIVHASQEFIQLIRSYLANGGSTALVRKALSAFAADHPNWYEKEIGKTLNIEPFAPAVLKVKEHDLHLNIEQFSERLVTHPFKTFILNDAKIFLGGSSVMDEDYFIFRISRPSFRSIENYYAIYRLVNQAAMDAKSNWEQFRAAYRKHFAALLRSNADVRAVALSIGEEARLLMQKQRSTKIIDTGPQGTFALFLAESLHLRMKDVETDVMLFAVYPWLAELFDGRYQTADAAYMYVIERNLARMQHSMDPLEKTSGTLAGFAVGDALGAPAVGILKEDFLRLKGSEILHYTTNPAHPYFFHLSAGAITGVTRMMLLTVEDLVARRGYDRSARIRSLSQWAMRVHSEPGYGRWPGTATFHAAIQLAYDIPANRAAAHNANSWGPVPRAIAVGLLYCTEKEILAIVQQETLLTHAEQSSVCGSAFVALLIHYLVHDENPYFAAGRALDELKDYYGKKIPSAFSHALRLAIRTTIEPHEAPAIFGTGTPVEQCIPLALYYFLRYPSHFRTPVQLAANSYRVDDPPEQRRLRFMSWAEQVLHSKGGNTNGIAAMVGAFLGAHNGLKIIDEQFVSVEDFDRIVLLGRQLEALRLKRTHHSS